MPHFFSGDELGSVKSVKFSKSEDSKSWKPEVRTVVSGLDSESADKTRAIQKLVVAQNDSETSVYRCSILPWILWCL